MPRAPFRRKSGAREANQLVRLAEGLASSKSRLPSNELDSFLTWTSEGSHRHRPVGPAEAPIERTLTKRRV